MHRELQAHRWALGAIVGATIFTSLLSSVSAAVDVPHVFEPGQVLLSEQLNEDLEALAAAIDARVIDEDMALPVTSEDGCTGLRYQLLELSVLRISSGASVAIELEPGLYACNEPIEIAHPDGQRITLRGTGSIPDDVVLVFQGAGLLVRNGNSLGMLHNLTLQGNATSNSDLGIHVDRASSLELSSVHIDGFHHGLFVSRSSTVVGNQIELRNNLQSGAFARLGASVELNGCQSHDNGVDGFSSFLGSTISITNSSATDNQGSGFSAARHATMTLSNVDSFGNGAFGYVAFQGAFMGRYGSYGSSGNGSGDTNIAPGVTHPNDGTVIYGL